LILLVASAKDVASLNIKSQILNHYPFKETGETFQNNLTYETVINNRNVKLVTLKEESIYAQTLPNSFPNLDLIVFISRHSSLSGTPTLSVHTPGNLANAELGGIPRKVSISPANAMREALKTMVRFKEEKSLNYEVSYECTHHGPSLDVPTMFAELGSSPEQWDDTQAAEAVGHAALKAISSFADSKAPISVGIGGPHYSAKFTRLALEKDIAFSHMIPKYALTNIDAEVIRQCVERTLEKVSSIVLDWKGIKGEDKPRLVEMLNTLNLPVTRV